jgi:hypothetical protein
MWTRLSKGFVGSMASPIISGPPHASTCSYTSFSVGIEI